MVGYRSAVAGSKIGETVWGDLRTFPIADIRCRRKIDA